MCNARYWAEAALALNVGYGSLPECRVMGNEPRKAAIRDLNRERSAADPEPDIHGRQIERLPPPKAANPLSGSPISHADDR